MYFSLFQQLAIVLGSVGFGLLIAWRIREKRIQSLERLLKQYKNKILDMEMRFGDLEAFTNHLRKKRSDSLDERTKQPSSIRNELYLRGEQPVKRL